MSEPKPDPLVRVALELVGEVEIEERSPSARQMRPRLFRDDN